MPAGLSEYDDSDNIKVLKGLWLSQITQVAGQYMEQGWKLAGGVSRLSPEPPSHHYYWMVTLVKDNHV